MKKIYIVILLFLGSLTACNDWLDVTPVFDVEEKNAFTTPDGYNAALTGLYQNAAKTHLYGKNLSWGFLSGMSQDYDYIYANDAYYGAIFNYTNTTALPIVNGIWEGLYNVIANANLLVKNIEKANPKMFTLDTLEKDRIHGEALGMRAILHLDIVRLFCPAPSSTGGNEKLVPYHDKFPSEFTVPKTTNETLDLIIRDLKKAADLLAPYDTIYKRSTAFSTNWANDDRWYRQDKRGYHFNYMAALCYLSRAYMHKGDWENALYYADYWYRRFSTGRKVYFKQNYPLFIFGDGKAGGQSSYKSYKSLHEVPFGLYNPDLAEMVTAYRTSFYGYGLFFGQGTFEGSDFDRVLFEDDLDDIRREQFKTLEVEDSWQDMWELIYSKQFDDEDGAYFFERQVIPMIRMSEMYYNMIECHYRLNNEAEALRLLQEWRKGKKMSKNIDVIPTLADLQDIIVKDARRDWIAQGQLFFLCKRMNRPLIENLTGNIIPFGDSDVTFPIPDSQDL